jgi:hypothetical protein
MAGRTPVSLTPAGRLLGGNKIFEFRQNILGAFAKLGPFLDQLMAFLCCAENRYGPELQTPGARIHLRS